MQFEAVPHEHRLDPAWITASQLGGLLVALVLAAGAAVAVFMLEPFDWNLGLALPAIVLPVFLGLAVFGLLWPKLEFERCRWSVTEEAFVIRRGVVFRSTIHVPRTRIQHTDVSQGPIQRRFGLASFTVHTAGTTGASVSLVGISEPTAKQLRDTLLEHMRDNGTSDGV